MNQCEEKADLVEGRRKGKKHMCENARTRSHKVGCFMEVVGVPSYSTHWMGRATPPGHVTGRGISGRDGSFFFFGGGETFAGHLHGDTILFFKAPESVVLNLVQGGFVLNLVS